MSDPIDVYTEAPHLLREQNDDLRAENMRLKLERDFYKLEADKYKSWYRESGVENIEIQERYDCLKKKVEGLLNE